MTDVGTADEASRREAGGPGAVPWQAVAIYSLDQGVVLFGAEGVLPPANAAAMSVAP